MGLGYMPQYSSDSSNRNLSLFTAHCGVQLPLAFAALLIYCHVSWVSHPAELPLAFAAQLISKQEPAKAGTKYRPPS